MGTIVSVEDVTGGYSTSNYVVGTDRGELFFLKEYRDGVPDMGLIEFTESFFSTGRFPVITPMPTKSEKKHVKFRGKVYVLYPFLNFTVSRSKDIKGRYAFNLGKFLGEMHAYSELNKNKYKNLGTKKYMSDKKRALAIFDTVLDILENTSEKDQLKRLTTSLIKKKIDYIRHDMVKNYGLNTHDYILLHGDYNNENIFYDKSGDIINIFDFEKSFIGLSSYELINTLIIVFFDSYKNQNFGRARTFLDGYQSVRRINKKEFVDALEFFISELFYTTIFEEERFLKNNNKLDKIFAHYNNSLDYFSKENNFRKNILKMIK